MTAVTRQEASATVRLQLPAGWTSTPAEAAIATTVSLSPATPRVTMLDLPVSQDACKSTALTINWSSN